MIKEKMSLSENKIKKKKFKFRWPTGSEVALGVFIAVVSFYFG